MTNDHIKDEGSLIGWALQNSDRLSRLREAMNRRIEDEALEDEDQFEDNEALITHMLDDVMEVYEDLAKHHFEA